MWFWSAFALGLSEIRRKTQRCHKNAYDGLENAYHRNVTEMYANCSSRNARCSVAKVEIISLAFKWHSSTQTRCKNARSNAPSPWKCVFRCLKARKSTQSFNLRPTCVSFDRLLAWTCVDSGRAQICTQVDGSFSPFGHPTQVDRKWTVYMCEIYDFLRLANPFGHSSQVRTQVLFCKLTSLHRLANASLRI